MIECNYIEAKKGIRKYKKRILVSVSTIILVVMIYNMAVRVTERYHPAVRALPDNVSNIKTCDAHYPGDVLFVIKAEMNQSTFSKYVVTLGFIPIHKPFTEKVYWLTDITPRGSQENVDWWNPTIEIENTYYNPNYKASYGALLKYENGYAYYQETTLQSWIFP